MLRRALLLSLLATTTFACLTDDGAPASAREASAPLVGRTIEFALDSGALDSGAIESIAAHLETVLAAESIAIEVRQSDDDATTVVITAHGRAAISDAALVADLRQTFTSLRNAIIAVEPAKAGPDVGKLAEIEVDGDDPDTVRADIEAQLRAQGVQGPIAVDIREHDDGKREVRVKVEQTHVE